jgi:uncharacterized protein (DUF2141 family)
MSLLILLFVSATVAMDQAPVATPRDRQPTAVGTASISGTVVSDEAEPTVVRHARITLRSTDSVVGQTTVTDDRGRFNFDGLPAGRYTVAAAKDGWIATTYGSRRPLRPGSAVVLAAGERVRIGIRLLRGAVITGELIDQHGLPAGGATVRAMRNVMRHGERVLDFIGLPAVADDRGIYRIYGLPPGDYVVGAAWRPNYLGTNTELRLTSDVDVRSAAGAESDPAVSPSSDRAVALASTFYPGTTVPGEAAMVTVGGGEERAGIDFPLRVVPTARIAGTLIAPDSGQIPSGLQVSLMAADAVSFADRMVDVFRNTAVKSDGSFTFVDIAPGQYTLFARVALPGSPNGSPEQQMFWASTDVSVEGDSISGLSLVLSAGTTLSGHIRFNGDAAPVDPTAVRVALFPEETKGIVSFAPVTAVVDAEGRFSVQGVTPGRYRLSASFPGLGRAGGWLLRSATAGGVETLDAPVTIRPGANLTDAVIEFTDRMAELTGMVQDVADAPVAQYTLILFPRESGLWTPQTRRIQAAHAATDGAFGFHALPPGNYLLVAVDDVDPGEWFDPACLKRLVPGATAIVLSEGEQTVQNVQVGGG